MRYKTLTLTSGDIRRGKPQSFRRCPLGLMLLREFNCEYVYVAPGIVQAYDQDRTCYHQIPSEKMLRVMRLVDAGRKKELKPTTFRVRV